MSYPADAFIRSTSERAHLGSLVYVRSIWTLSARFDTPQQPNNKTMILTGQEAGKIYGRFSDYGLCTAPDVQVDIRIPELENIAAERSYARPAALVIAADGHPQLWGHIAGSEVHRYGFTLKGEPLKNEEHELTPFIQFQKYEIWLSRAGKLLSDKALFVVGG